MKNRLSIPKRGHSNPPMKNLVSSDKLEEETKMMEQRLRELKDIMAEEAVKREVTGATGSRWKAASSNLPIKNYAKQVLESKPRLPPNVKLNKENFSNTVQIQNSGTQVREKVTLNSTTSATSNKLSSTGSMTSFSRKTTPKSSQPRSSNNSTPVGAGSQTPQSTQSIQAKPTRPEDKFVNIEPQAKTRPTPASMTKQQNPKLKPKNDEDDDEMNNKQAEMNLKRALLSQKESNEVDLFLKKNGLVQYCIAFKENGFDDLETVMEIQPKHLLDMKIPSGHQIKLTKLIEKLREGNPQYKKPILPTQLHSIETSTDMSLLQTRLVQATPRDQAVTSSQTIDNSNMSPNKRDLHTNKIPKLFSSSISASQAGGDLLNGTYDEEESRKAFQEALMEWRNAGKASETDTGNNNEVESEAKPPSRLDKKKSVKFADSSLQTEEEKTVKDNGGEEDDDEYGYISSRMFKKPTEKSVSILKKEPVKEEKPKFSLLFSGESTWNMENYPVNNEAETGMSPKNEDKKVNKLSCWHCYKTVEEESLTIQCYGKKFCDDNCLKEYKTNNLIECGQCGKKVVIDEAIVKNKRRFCSQDCSYEAPHRLDGQPKKQVSETEIKNLDGPWKEQYGDENNGDSNNFMGDLDLTVDIGINRNFISLEELEQKYKVTEN